MKPPGLEAMEHFLAAFGAAYPYPDPLDNLGRRGEKPGVISGLLRSEDSQPAWVVVLSQGRPNILVVTDPESGRVMGHLPDGGRFERHNPLVKALREEGFEVGT